MSNNGALWGEQIGHQLTAARANAQIANANRELGKAEAYHRGTIAQLAAALRALGELAPDHPLHQQSVLDVIDHDGSRTSTFQEAWRIEHDPQRILIGLQEARATAVAVLLPALEREQVEERAGGFLWLSKRYYWWGDRYSTRINAEKTRDCVLQSLRTGTINDPHDPDGLKRAAWHELGFGQPANS